MSVNCEKGEDLSRRKKAICSLLLKSAKATYSSNCSSEYIAPFSPSPLTLISNVLHQVQLSQSDIVYDLGCGDGRWLVSAVSKFSCKAVGIELDQVLVEKTLEKVQTLHLTNDIEILHSNVMGIDISRATFVIMYAFSKSIVGLKEKMEKELKPNTTVLSIGFHVPGWKIVWCDQHEGLKCYMYKIPKVLNLV